MCGKTIFAHSDNKSAALGAPTVEKLIKQSATSESGNLFHKRLYLGADVRRCSGDSRQRRIFAAARAKA
jgi:hypothetical protein